jgi:hypothetical protein
MGFAVSVLQDACTVPCVLCPVHWKAGVREWSGTRSLSYRRLSLQRGVGRVPGTLVL